MRTAPHAALRRVASGALLASAVALGGCAAVAPGAPPSAAARTYHEDIDIGGRLSVSYRHLGQQHSMQGGFSWNQEQETLAIALISPLGQTMADVSVTPGRAILRQSGSPPRVASDATRLTELALGWPLPVEGLREWLQGFARDAHGELQPADKELERDGWRVRYVSWQGEPPGPSWPRRIDIEREGGAQPIALRIVIDDWRPK